LGINTYTLKGKDGSSIDFMALTMIDPASSWLKVVDLPTITRVTTKKVNGKERTIEEEIFDKSSDIPEMPLFNIRQWVGVQITL